MTIYKVTDSAGAFAFVDSDWTDDVNRVAEEYHAEHGVYVSASVATVREALEFAFGDDWSRSIDHVVTRLDGYPADEPVIVFRYAQDESIQGYGDTVSVANYRVLADQWSDYEALDSRGPYSDSHVIALRLDSPAPSDLIEVIRGLEDYPVLSEDELSTVEMELVDEHWEIYGLSDTVRAVERALGDVELTDYAREVITALTFRGFIEELTPGSNYPTVEDYSSVDFGTERVAEWIKARRGRTVTVNHWGGDTTTFDLRDSALIAR